MDTLGAAPLLCPAPGAKSVLPPAYVRLLRFSLYFVSCNALYVPPAPDRGLTNVHSRASTESALLSACAAHAPVVSWRARRD